MTIQNEGNIGVLEELAQEIHNQLAYLSEVDGAIGDGDHGVNMDKGFKTAMDNIHVEGATSLSEGFTILGRTLIMDIGGSMGPLYGTFFREFGKSCKNVEVIDRDRFGEMLDAAQAGLQRFDRAKVGDKTLQDTLVPAICAYHEAAQANMDFRECLEAMVDAAETGWQSTKDMVAKIGRAARLGERSRGVLDAGATSCFFILRSIQRSVCSRLA